MGKFCVSVKSKQGKKEKLKLPNTLKYSSISLWLLKVDMKMSSMHDTVEMKNSTNGTSQTQVRKLELEL